MHICSLCCQSSLTEIASDTSGSSDCSEDDAKIENSESMAPSSAGSRVLPSRHRSPQAHGRHIAAPAVHHDVSSTWTSRTQRQPGGRGNEKAPDLRSARPSTSSVPPACHLACRATSSAVCVYSGSEQSHQLGTATAAPFGGLEQDHEVAFHTHSTNLSTCGGASRGEHSPAFSRVLSSAVHGQQRFRHAGVSRLS